MSDGFPCCRKCSAPLEHSETACWLTATEAYCETCYEVLFGAQAASGEAPAYPRTAEGELKRQAHFAAERAAQERERDRDGDPEGEAIPSGEPGSTKGDKAVDEEHKYQEQIDRLQALVNECGIAGVVSRLSVICGETAQKIQKGGWADASVKSWKDAGAKLAGLAADL